MGWLIATPVIITAPGIIVANVLNRD
jgi:hypothetical protein